MYQVLSIDVMYEYERSWRYCITSS